jgi:transcription initiation factor TFIIH subunit 1
MGRGRGNQSTESTMSSEMMEYSNGGAPLNEGDVSHYINVLHKERLGDLKLSPSKLTFQIKNISNGNGNGSHSDVENAVPNIEIEWKDVMKHQVSPAKYPKPLLKILLTVSLQHTVNSNKPNNSLTFQMQNREELEQIRKDITNRLHHRDHVTSASTINSNIINNSKKRPHSDLNRSISTNHSFGNFDPTAMAVTRAALLASNDALRQQHKHLVTETNTVSEEDFWHTHVHLLEDEYAKISGMAKPGTSSLLQSHLPSSGRVTLGVEEMRQIFILYPAVHKAYEEKVPLELSDEQFWRKYLESEYFHRDRGRIGTVTRNHAPIDNNNNENKRKQEKSSGPTFEQQEARAAAVGSDDLFSRYAQKLKEENGQNDVETNGASDTSHRRWGTHLAVGQFDLASTIETDRGKLLEGPKDNYPANQNDDGKGSRVIQKYNRHWAMVLYPDEAVAGSDLLSVSRRSVRDIVQNDNDPLVQGGVDEEMRRLVDFANTREEDANHASGSGHLDDDKYEPLTLQNIEAYFVGNINASGSVSYESNERHCEYAQKMKAQTQVLVDTLFTESNNASLSETCFPPPSLGRELLSALTKKMAKDSETEAHSVEMANKLPADLRNRLQSYFRRSSELLRHFFGLRRLSTDSVSKNSIDTSTINAQTSQKLAKIVGGMDTLYREMDSMRKALTQTETDEMMRKMCLPIMDQLDWAFKLYREGSGGGSSGGFVTVEEL